MVKRTDPLQAGSTLYEARDYAIIPMFASISYNRVLKVQYQVWEHRPHIHVREWYSRVDQPTIWRPGRGAGFYLEYVLPDGRYINTLDLVIEALQKMKEDYEEGRLPVASGYPIPSPISQSPSEEYRQAASATTERYRPDDPS